MMGWNLDLLGAPLGDLMEALGFLKICGVGNT